MILHQPSAQQVLGAVARELRLDQPLRLRARRDGWLQVSSGAVWLTLDGGGPDHVLAPGQCLWLGRGVGAVVESWQPGLGASRLQWRLSLDPQPRPVLRPAWVGLAGFAGVTGLVDFAAGWRAGALTAAARGLRAVAGALAAAARSADASARRSQGCISAGDSMASSGAVQ